MISLTRYYTPNATWGELSLGAFRCSTIERPWMDNTQRASCIPEGTYTLGLRTSPVVQRTSGGAFREGWEVQHVAGRSFIMFHPGNWSHDVEGCIAVGAELAVMSNALAVTDSRNTFRRFMSVLSDRDSWTLRIHQWRP